MNENLEQFDDSIKAIASDLDRLGQHERDAAPVTLERDALHAIQTQVLDRRSEPLSITRASPWWRHERVALGMAATIMLGFTVAMVFMVNRPSPMQPQPTLAVNTAAEEFEEYIETVAWLSESMPQFIDDSSNGGTTELDSLDALFTDVQESLQGTEETG